FDPRALTEVLCSRVTTLTLGRAAPLGPEEPTILATGGFGAGPALVAEHIRPAAPLRVRASPWSTGDGLRHGLERGGSLSAGMDEFYGRNMPDRAWDEPEFVSASQLYARRARIVD